ncbi:MAG: tetratricopeptide repeat protein [Acetobacteraceae bacterium]|nr:tetratricopeptide repeat protein [Acetobacteraceae bacterium]
MDSARRRRHLGVALQELEAGMWKAVDAACVPLFSGGGAEDPDASLLVGLAAAARGETIRAAAILNKVASQRPKHAHPATDLVALAPQLTRDQIAAQFRACFALTPKDTRLHEAFTDFLLGGGEARDAHDVVQHWLEQEPRSAVAHNAAGTTLAELGDVEGAIRHFEQTVALAPNDAASWSNLGMMLKTAGHFDSALMAYNRAIAHSPYDPQIRVNRAVALLKAGHWAEAWPDYEWRLRLPGHLPLPLDRLLPSISEKPDLAGITVLVTHEDGFGDTLHFMRYLPLLARHGARVLVWVPPELERVVCMVPGVTAVLTGDLPPPAYDYHCPFVSLPRVFATTLETIPREAYLQTDQVMAAGWARHFPADVLRVGLVWAGQARPWAPGFITLDRRRSIALAEFAPLAGIRGVRFVSLQKGPAAEQAYLPPPSMELYDPMEHVVDFAETAAIISNLDLVVSVDTSVVHLAGAMGKPVFLLDRYDNCWRWLSTRADSPWYPQMTIFRQSRIGDWSEPMERAAAALGAMAAFRAGAARTVHPRPAPQCADAA